MANVKIEQEINQIKDPATRQAVYRIVSAVVDDLETITNKLDADDGVTDTDYNAGMTLEKG